MTSLTVFEAVINLRREDVLSQIIDLLHQQMERYQDDPLLCTFNCDAMVLGIMTRELRSMGLILKPESPFAGKSYETVKEKIKKMRFSGVGKVHSQDRRSYYDAEDHGDCNNLGIPQLIQPSY